MKIDLQQINQSTNLELLARQQVEGFITGLHKSPYHGFSVEFAEHRLYNEGESTRHIDWKVFARTDRLFTKRYEEETNLRCLIAIDTSASMFYPSDSKAKIRYSAIVSASLAYLLNMQRDAVGLCLFAEQIEALTPIKSTPTHMDKLLVILNDLLKREPRKTHTNVAGVLHEIAQKIHRRSLVVIFSDMFDGENKNTEQIFSALQHLKHNRHEVIVFHVMDYSTELSFEFDDRPIEFIDLENQQRLKLNPADVRETYRAEAARFYKQLELRCHQYKIDFVPADVREDINTILQTYLIKRARMK